MQKLKLKAFTLVEMLIVIVIIGILIAALLPRLQGAQGRARDVARKNNLNQIGTAIAAYVSDYGRLPYTGATSLHDGKVNGTDTLAELLLKEGMINNVPMDPQSGSTWSAEGKTVTGSFLFVPMKKNTVERGGFALIAKVEVAGSANWVQKEGANTVADGALGTGVDIQNFYPCTTVEKVDGTTIKLSSSTGQNCQYTDGNQLRYVYVY